LNQLHIAFQDASVLLRSDADDLLALIGRRFRHLQGNRSATPLATVEIRRHGSGFSCTAPDGTSQDVKSVEAAARWAQYQAIEQIILAKNELIWFHGAAVGVAGRAVVMPGRRGRGKSTLSRALWERGATFLTDDILPLEPENDLVVPFPQLPAVRTDPGRHLDEDALAWVPKDEIEIDERVEHCPLPVGALVLPGFQREARAEILPCSRGEAALALLEGCWNIERHREAAAAYVAKLSPKMPVCRLVFGLSHRVGPALGLDWPKRRGRLDAGPPTCCGPPATWITLGGGARLLSHYLTIT
jgi:hypothetical protein